MPVTEKDMKNDPFHSLLFESTFELKQLLSGYNTWKRENDLEQLLSKFSKEVPRNSNISLTGNSLEIKFSGIIPNLLTQKPEVGLEICTLTSPPGDSSAGFSLRTTDPEVLVLCRWYGAPPTPYLYSSRVRFLSSLLLSIFLCLHDLHFAQPPSLPPSPGCPI